MRTKEIAKT